MAKMEFEAKQSLKRLDAQKTELKNQLDQVHEKLNSTISYTELTAKNAETTILQKMKNFILPFALGAAGIILFLMFMWILVCCLFGKIKQKMAKHIPRPFHRPERSNRAESNL